MDEFVLGENDMESLAEDSNDVISTEGFGKKIFQKNIDTVMHESMMPYSEHVILDRAIPRVEDGLKPSQRRVLYTMLELGVTPDKPHRKSARIVGDCLGKYHPHGDTSVYDAMVRMAQPFNMRACLVDGHGNFGSIDGDGAAAMRYTEARMTPLALEMLRDLDKDTVPFELNFDDTLKEPTILPSRFPNLLVNGASGIAVGLATNIPTHNLGEVISGVCAYIDNPDITLNQLMKIIPAPDFPTGGYIIAGEELKTAYETGRGKIKLRAKLHIEENAGRQTIVITELPYQVNKARLLQRILELRDTKKELLNDIAEIADESDYAGMRATIKLKKDANAKEVLDALFKYSDLECSYGINMVAIADGRPQQMGLMDIIAYYVDYQRQIVVRRTKFDLDAARERAHILEGLVIAVTNIDEVVQIIKKSASPQEAKVKLKDRFVLSERQAQAILDMRLARLTNLEVEKLQQELAEVKALIERLNAILNSRTLQFETIKTEICEIKKKYADERRSTVIASEADYVVGSADDSVPVEKSVVVLSGDGTIKRMSVRSFASAKKEIDDKSSEADALVCALNTFTDRTILCFTEKGNCAKLAVTDIPEMRYSAAGISTADLALTDEKEKIVSIFELPDDLEKAGELLFVSSGGMIKRSAWTEYGLQKNFYQAVKIKEDETLVCVQQWSDDGYLTFATKLGYVLVATKDDVPPQGRISAGVKGVSLSDDDAMVAFDQTTDSDEIAIITKNAFAKRVAIAEIEKLARYRKGTRIVDVKTAGEIVCAVVIGEKEKDILCFDKNEKSFGHNTSEIVVKGKNVKPILLKNTSKIEKAIQF